MSSVRWCDKHQGPFSENSPDWTTGSITRRVRNKQTHRMESVSIDQDFCGPCSKQMNVGLFLDDEAPALNGDTEPKPDDPGAEYGYGDEYRRGEN